MGERGRSILRWVRWRVTSVECSEMGQFGGGHIDDQGLIVLFCNSVILPILTVLIVMRVTDVDPTILELQDRYFLTFL